MPAPSPLSNALGLEHRSFGTGFPPCLCLLLWESCLASSTVNKQLHNDEACLNPTRPTHSVSLIGLVQALFVYTPAYMCLNRE